ncbi:MAG: TraB/GumN family protein [Burkholderiaceae bacterium]
MRGTLRKFLAYPLIGAWLLLVGVAHAQTDRGLAWKIEKDGKTSYLLGTVHFWKQQWLPLNAPIEQAFANSKTLAVEADVEKMDAAAVAGRMMLPGAETLASRLDGALYSQVKAEAEKIGIPEAAVNKFKPWAVMMVFAATKVQQLGYAPDAGIDLHLIKKAKAAGKPVVELESAEQQLQMLDSLTARTQSGLLAEYFASSERTPQVVEAIIGAWKRGDADALFALNRKGFSDDEVKREFEDKFLYQRDLAMTRKIEDLMRQPGPHFIAVGALHLVGPRSIIEQLKAKGYKVERM